MNGMSSGQSMVRVDRVVAVAATLQDGREQLGSGYLVTGRLVLTAEHCTRDKATGEAAVRLRLIRASDGVIADVVGMVPDRKLDVAVLQVADDAPWEADLAPLGFARVDQTQAGVLDDCVGIGFPLFQRDPNRRTRHTSEFHGKVYQTDEQETGRLLMREPLIDPGPVTDPKTERVGDQGEVGLSPWGGLSGALMFYRGSVIGVVVEHHPRQGDSALLAMGFERIAANASIRHCLGLPGPELLPWVREQTAVLLAGLVDVINGDDLPRLAELNPYLLGATPTAFGDKDSYGQHDPYVPRTREDFDSRLRAALQPGRLVLVVGPSKSGKTRTAFEAARQSWPQAHVLVPASTGLESLVNHPRLASTADPMVVWLDDLERFLTGTHPLTLAMLAQLLSRPGRTVVLATLRHEQRDLLKAGGERTRDTRQLLRHEQQDLLKAGGELTRDTRQLLDNASDTTFELGLTSADPDEQAAARAAYPAADLSATGLGEQLAGAPALLSQYHRLEYSDPLQHAVMQTAIDWGRVGMFRPIPSPDLSALALDTLLSNRPDLDPTEQQITQAIKAVRTPPDGAGRVAALRTVVLADRTRGYLPFDYLVAADDGQTRQPRAIPDSFWGQVLARADPDDAYFISVAAHARGNIPAAVHAARHGADAGNAGTMLRLGILLADRVDPPELAEARTWFTKAADAGNPTAMPNLGVLLAYRMDPPELAEARTWFTRAAEGGDTDAMLNLGVLLASRVDPPELAEARTWFTRAAEAGDTDAMLNLGILLESRVDPPELAEARTWYTKAADAGNTRAMLNLAYLLMNRVDPPELAEARTWYTKAADAGNTTAMFYLGNLLADQGDPELSEAHTWYIKAYAGDTDAMFNLAYLLASWVDPPELAEARTWYTKAADAGNTGAMFNLGILLAFQVDPPELAEARTWLTRAADAGHVSAEYHLGVLYGTQGDADRASRAWRGVIEKHQENDLVSAAALALAAVSALQGDLQAARQLLDLASESGCASAATYAGALDPDAVVRTNACQRLRDFAGDTDALNFLGIEAYSGREYDQAHGYWTRSKALGDGVSPLLLRLTAASSSSTKG